MSNQPVVQRRRGRPPKGSAQPAETKQAIIQAGLELLSEKGASATGIDQVLKTVKVPKGSFYHYFSSKDDFLLAVIQAYDQYLGRKLNKHLCNQNLAPTERLRAYMDDAAEGVERYHFKRGCLLGNMGQEINLLSDTLREAIDAAFQDWEQQVQRCLEEGISRGELSPHLDCKATAVCFWMGWEGAIMRARLQREVSPLSLFAQQFIDGLPR